MRRPRLVPWGICVHIFEGTAKVVVAIPQDEASEVENVGSFRLCGAALWPEFSTS